MDTLRSEIIAYLETATGRRITYESVSPSILRYLEIREVVIHTADEGPGELLRVNRVRVYYRLIPLLRRSVTGAISRISVENSSFSINTEEDQDLITFLKELTENRPPPQQDDLNILITGRNLTVGLDTPIGELDLDRVFFRLKTGLETFEVQLDSEIAATSRVEGFGLKDLATSLRITGRVDRNLETADLRLHFAKIATNLLGLDEQTFHIVLRDELWELRKIQDRIPLDLYATFSVPDGEFSAGITFDSFAPTSYLKLTDEAGSIREWLSTPLSGEARLRYSIDNSAISYTADLRAPLDSSRLATLAGGPLPVEGEMNLSAILSGSNERLSFSELRLDSAQGSASFTGTLDMESLVPDGNLTIEDLTFPFGRPLSAKLYFRREGDTLKISEGSMGFDGINLVGLNAALRMVEDTIDFDLSTQVDKAPTDSLIHIEGSLGLEPDIVIEASAELRSIPIPELYQAITGGPLPSVLEELFGSALVETEAFIRRDPTLLFFSLPNLEFRDSLSGDSISASVSGNDSSISISNALISWAGIEADASVSALLDSEQGVEFDAALTYQDTAYELFGVLTEGGDVVLEGNFGIDGEAKKQGDGYEFTLSTQALPIPMDNRIVRATLDVSGNFTDASNWSIDAKNTIISPLPFIPVEDASLTLTGRFGPEGGGFSRLVYNDERSRLEGSGEYAMRLGNWDNIDATLNLEGGR